MERVIAVMATFAVGALVALQPPVNSVLGRATTVIGAAFVSTVISSIVLGALVLALGETGQLRGIGEVSWIYLTGGLMGAALITVSLVTVRELGAGGVVAATVAGQLLVSAVLDKFGAFGLDQTDITPQRLAGFALLAAGTALVVMR